jgi:stage II sporulation protein D
VTADTEPPLVRVLLERTTGQLRLPQPGRPYRVTWPGGETWLWGPLAATISGGGSWQVGAFRDAERADSAGEALRKALGPSVDVLQAAAVDGLIRVRVSWLRDPPSDPAAALAAVGFPGAFAVPGGAALLLEGLGGRVETDSEVTIDPFDAWPTVVEGSRYRGRFRLRLHAGELLLINELNLERYLSGVVPVEMGPAQFPELEALKAQAVAARTYAVAHLGDHEDEGYDLCATPACQAYGGADREHPLSSRAVEETAGVVAVYDGVPIDAMYTSTCGGHTEDAAALFPDRAQPYLVGVACRWERPLVLHGREDLPEVANQNEFRRRLALQVLDLSDADPSPQRLVEGVAVLCDGEVEPLGPAPSFDRYAGALITAGGLDEAVRLLTDSGAEGLVRLADLHGVPLDLPEAGSWREGWHAEAALAVLQLQGVVVEDRGDAVAHPVGVAIYPRRAARSEPLPEPLPLYWSWGRRLGTTTGVQVSPGTTLERYRHGEDLLAVVVVLSGGGGEADRRSAWRSWARERAWSDLAEALGVSDLEELVVTRRGRSGRVVGLQAVGQGGEVRSFEGFPIRRVLDLPENLFSFHALTRSDGERVVRFLGRGWGHGVGLCQNGAYGLARSGQSFRQILETYYQGVELVEWPVGLELPGPGAR